VAAPPELRPWPRPCQKCAKKLLPLGYDLVTSGPQGLRTLIAGDLVQRGKLVRDSGIKPQ
jgi:hypothetical protein